MIGESHKAWLCIPSAQENGGTIPLWMERGYGVAVWREPGKFLATDLCFERPYPGYAKAVNELIRNVGILDRSAEWFVIGGDDVEPDPNHTPDEIARQCRKYFPRIPRNVEVEISEKESETFGVMLPVNEYPEDSHPVSVYGSAWLGRSFCERINQGRGPLLDGIGHEIVCQSVVDIAAKYGLLWERGRIVHRHRELVTHLDRELTDTERSTISERFYNLTISDWPGTEPLKYVRRVPDTHLLEPITR